MTCCADRVEEWCTTQACLFKQRVQIITFLFLLSQSGFFLRNHDQQMAICLGEDIFQLDWHRAVCVDSGCSAGPHKP